MKFVTIFRVLPYLVKYSHFSDFLLIVKKVKEKKRVANEPSGPN